jgi:DNA-binding response OmpR family regulator
MTDPVERVLVVDDDPAINMLLQTRLRLRGLEVYSASDGEQTIEMLSSIRPDLIFLDVMMPGMSGMDVLREIRSRELDLAVVMTTAFGSESVAIEALRLGADDYLRKPFERADFEAVIARTMTRLRLSRENTELQNRLDRQRRLLQAEIARAAQVQADLLPKSLPSLPGLEIAARCLPALEVGGDFYDWQASEASLLLTLGDVMGKGMSAALLMATVRAALRTLATEQSPARALSLVHDALSADLERLDSYVTLYYLHIDPATRHIRYVDAGHGHGFVLRRDGTAHPLPVRSMPLGIAFHDGFVEGGMTLSAGDSLVLYSDGLTDSLPSATNEPAQLMPFLAGVVSAADMVDRLIAASEPGESARDDLTVTVIRAID